MWRLVLFLWMVDCQSVKGHEPQVLEGVEELSRMARHSIGDAGDKKQEQPPVFLFRHREVPQQDRRRLRYAQQQQADMNNIWRTSKAVRRQDHAPQVVYVDALNALVGQHPREQLEGLRRLLDHTPITEDMMDVPDHPQSTPHAEDLDVVAKAHLEEALAKARSRALAQVEAQHRAIAIARLEAQEKARAQLALYSGEDHHQHHQDQEVVDEARAVSRVERGAEVSQPEALRGRIHNHSPLYHPLYGMRGSKLDTVQPSNVIVINNSNDNRGHVTSGLVPIPTASKLRKHRVRVHHRPNIRKLHKVLNNAERALAKVHERCC